MAQRGRVLSLRTQIFIFTLLACIILVMTTLFSLNHAGIIHIYEQDELPDNGNISQGAIQYAVVNGTETTYIQPLISSLTVQFTCSADNIESIHWDFGDGNGAEGIVVINNYSLPGVYLVEAAITFEDGSHLIEYYYLDLDAPVIYSLNVPYIGHVWTFYTFTLLVGAITSFVLFIIAFYLKKKERMDLWPKAFTLELRIIVGFWLLFDFFLAIGFFNGIIADVLSAMGV